MAKADIHTFGGLMPKASPRALDGAAAQVAHNLSPQTNEFLPLPQDTQVIANSAVNNPKTIFRFKRKADGTLATDFTDLTQWYVSALKVSWAAGQVNNDLTDRHYISFDNGSAPPRAVDATGGSRQLGVPQPATAPAAVLNVVDEFTTEERGDAITSILSWFDANATSYMVPVWRGRSDTDPTHYRPGTGTHGYLDREGIPNTTDDLSQQVRLFETSSTAGADNGTITSDYVGHSDMSWPFDPALGGFWKPSTGGWPTGVTWATTKDHWCIPFTAYGLTYDIAAIALRDALADIDLPGGAAGEKLVDTGTADAIVAHCGEVGSQLWTDVAPKLNALYAKVQDAKILFDGGQKASLVASMAAFYAQSDITTLFSNAIANAAEEIWNQALIAHDYVDFEAPGGGP
jgi:hypothetical protein